MVSRTTSTRVASWIGWCALIGFSGAGIAAWLAVGRKISITLSEALPAEGSPPDPIALLDDDVRALREDLQGLTRTLAEEMQALHADLADSSAERERGLREVLAASSTALDRRLDDLATRAGSLEAAVRELSGSRLSAEPALEAAPPPPTAETSAASGERPPASAPLTAGAPAAASAPARETRGFLSFQLPSETFAFGALQRFAIVPSLSRVGFDARSTLHDFSGVSQQVDGRFNACLAEPEKGLSGSITVQAASLATGNDARDEDMRRLLDVARHGDVRFELLTFERETVDAAAQTLRGTVKGRMTIKGRTREVAMPARLHVDASKRLVVEGQAPLRLSDYGIETPRQLGVISMEDEVTIWISLRARCLGRVESSEKGTQEPARKVEKE